MTNKSAGPIKLFVLGDARIETPTAVIEPTAELVFSASLLFLIGKREPIARTTIQQLLWPEVPTALASHRLRQTLLKARRLGVPVLASGTTRLSIGPTEVVRDFDTLLAAPSADPSLETFSLDLLPAFEPDFSQPFCEWLDSWKLAIGGPLTRLVLGLIARARVEGHWAAVELHAKRLLQFAPFNEEATLALAESLAMRGDKLKAVRILDSYLGEVGRGPGDLRLSADLMRRRIADRMTPRVHNLPSDIPLLARERMMEHLSERMQVAQSGTGQACIVWGDPGIGKSRLLTEFLSFSSLQGIASHRIYCRSSDSGRPFAVLLELVPNLRGMRGAIGAAPETLAYLETLTKHRPRSNGSPETGRDDESAYAQLDHALIDLLGAISDESAFVLAIEDCHWMDVASATVLSRIVGRLDGQPILLIFTSRGFEDGPLTTLPLGVDHLSIPPLSESDSAELVHYMVRQRGKQISPTYLRWCIAVAEGNPYFLQELSNHFVETGDEYGAPPSLTAVLRQRLARLSPEGLQLLQTCALLENHATLDVIEEVLGYEGHRLLQAINELASSGMLVSEANKMLPGASSRVNSRHDLLSETALMQLAPAARNYLHRRAARVLEAAIDRHGDVSTLWSCAKHWQLAGDTPHALRLATSCAVHLLHAGLPQDAGAAFDKALSYCSSDSETLALLEQQATAFYRCSSWRRVMEIVPVARALKKRLQPELNGHDDLELMLLRAEWQTLHWNEIMRRSLVCLYADAAPAAHRVEAGVMALMIITFSGDRSSASDTFDAILNISRSTGVPAALVLQARMVFHTNWGEFGEAIVAARELILEQQTSGNVGELFRALCNASVTFRAAGFFDEASNSLVDALEIAERHHLPLAKARAIPMLANLALERGNLTDARRWLSILEATGMDPQDRLGQLEIRTIGARIALLEGRANDANLLVERDLAEFSIDLPHRRAYGAALRVAIDLGLHRIPSPTVVKELHAAHQLTRSNVFQAFPTFALYAGLRAIGQPVDADKILADYLRHYRREPWPAPVHLLNALIGESLDLAEASSPQGVGISS